MAVASLHSSAFWEMPTHARASAAVSRPCASAVCMSVGSVATLTPPSSSALRAASLRILEREHFPDFYLRTGPV
jgi:hypothetical protein